MKPVICVTKIPVMAGFDLAISDRRVKPGDDDGEGAAA